MQNNSVVDTYNALVDDIDKLAKRLSEEIPAFLVAEEVETVRLLASSTQKFKALGRWLERLRGLFTQRLAISISPSEHQQEPYGAATPYGRASRTRLRVTLADGRTLEEDTAAATFALAIQEMSLERVAQLGWRVNGEPLVSQTPSCEYAQVKLGRWYVMTHSNTKYKQRILNGLATEFGMVIKVEIVH